MRTHYVFLLRSNATKFLSIRPQRILDLKCPRFLHRRLNGSGDERALMADWPTPRPRNWRAYVNRVETEAELAALRRSLERGVPFGESSWRDKMVRKFGLESTVRARGRPRKEGKGS